MFVVDSCADTFQCLDSLDGNCVRVKSRSWTAVMYCVIHRIVRAVESIGSFAEN